MQATLTLSDGREYKVDVNIEAEVPEKPTVAFDGTLLQVIDGYFIDSSMPTTDSERIVRLTCHDEVDWACFDSREHAKEFDNRMHALYHIKKWVAENDNGFVPDWNNEEQEKWGIGYAHDVHELYVTSWHSWCINPDFPQISSVDKALNCKEECKEHLEVYFRIKN